MSVQAYPELARRWDDEKEHLFQVSLAVRGLMIGQANNVLEVTLDPGATSTEVSDTRIAVTSKAFLTARSASAAAATGVWVATSHGKFTIYHDSSPATNRYFGVLFVG